MEFLQAALLTVAGLAAGSSQGWKASGCVGLGGRSPPAAGAVDGLGAVWLLIVDVVGTHPALALGSSRAKREVAPSSARTSCTAAQYLVPFLRGPQVTGTTVQWCP